MITAPYNFVPLNKEVFYPNWADKVSHDIPFEDAVSGTIEIKIDAHSPIFVRDSKNEQSFCSHNGLEYIPGSSVKGSIRTVLDVLSYGKLKLQDKRLSYRDLNHKSYKKKAMDGNKIHMGWLEDREGEWYIEDLGKTTSSECRIKYFEMEAHLDKKLVSSIRKKRQAYEKYQVVKDRDKLETNDGTIVFTGTVGSKKTREFFFPKKVKRELLISQNIVKTFKQAYYIGEVDENENWKKLWSKELKKGKKIPVFFQVKDNEVAHFGLSMLYKLPYEQTIGETLASFQDYDENKPDLGETLFGYVKEKNALKGRVQFSHFFIKEKVDSGRKAVLPLSSPRSTFFPAYLEQNMSANGKTKDYKTYDDKDAVLRGFKFYPPQREATYTDGICKDHPKVCTTFFPLDKGTTFEGKVRFFNLKKSELGALLSALTLLEEEGCFHKLGMGKPFGFGTVKLLLQNIQTTKKEQLPTGEYIKAFTEEMQHSMNIDLHQDNRVESLIALSSYSIPDKELKYMKINDFVLAKKPFNKFCLPRLDMLTSKSVATNSIKVKTENNQQVSKPKSTKPQSTEVFSMKQIASAVSATVQEVIDFSVGLHFGTLTPIATLKPQQAKDLINRMGGKGKVQTPMQNHSQDGISKTKMRKAIMGYWKNEFDMMYHRNQIKEFLSQEGFETTPEEQREVYEDRKEDESFVKMCKLIGLFEFGEISEDMKEALYIKLIG